MSAEDGWLYDEALDRFFGDMPEALDWYKSRGLELPSYLLECEQNMMGLHAELIVDEALADFHEGAKSNIPDEEMQRLQAFLDAWCDKQGVCSWFPTTTLVPVPRGAK